LYKKNALFDLCASRAGLVDFAMMTMTLKPLMMMLTMRRGRSRRRRFRRVCSSCFSSSVKQSK
jgi:hypothetical protein